MDRISRPWRLAIFAKSLLLIALGAALITLAALQLREGGIVRAGFAALLAFLGFFLAAASIKGLRDVAEGVAITERDVVPLPHRRAGYSMRTPGGRFVEFILWNPWEPLRQTEVYDVTYGRHSGIIVARPRPAIPDGGTR